MPHLTSKRLGSDSVPEASAKRVAKSERNDASAATPVSPLIPDSSGEDEEQQPGSAAYATFRRLLQSGTTKRPSKQSRSSSSLHRAGRPESNNSHIKDLTSHAQQPEDGSKPALGNVHIPAQCASFAGLHSGPPNNTLQAQAFKGVGLYSAHPARDMSLQELKAWPVERTAVAKLDQLAWDLPWNDATWLTSGTPLPSQFPQQLAQLGIKERLVNRWLEAAAEAAAPGAAAAQAASSDFQGQQQAVFMALCSSYKDILHPVRPYPTRHDDLDPIMDAALLHCLNHLATAAARIKKNNDLLKAGETHDPPRDQGFVRPKVLILLPLRSMAERVVLRLATLAQKETRTDSIQNKPRFLREFAFDADADADDLQQKGRPKPADHQALFRGNTDDHYKLGIKTTRGSIRLYTEFYDSDIIVASPLALASQLEEGKEGTADFLASIEIALVDRCDVMQMQNWSHVVRVFEALNRTPSEQHGTDIMRIWEWALGGHAKFYRQNILLSSFASAPLNALFHRLCCSHAGCARLSPLYKGVLGSAEQARQVFERISPAALTADADARFNHFRKALWPSLKDRSGQLVFVSSYFDFVRLRNWLAEQDGASWGAVSEYTEAPEVARARSLFAKGRTRILLYTERLHFYFRHHLRGVQDIVFYQLPEHASYFNELLHMMTDGRSGTQQLAHATATSIFSQFDSLALQHVCGTKRAKRMLKADSAAFMFC
ncbi:hypothetical protein WJX74_004003 [Apatococcus lobatus]|uniref:U3 small nucleolar RNA-associated protein 25 n=1 Tax=Apatococcus lobatus TaxID=904363 RepID=A0AAW1S6D8_9CHLO